MEKAPQKRPASQVVIKIPPALIKEFGNDVRVLIKDHSPWGLNPLGLKQLANANLMKELLKTGDIVYIPR